VGMQKKNFGLNMNKRISLSVISPVKDDLKILNLIDSLKKPEFIDDVEFIVVFNGSLKNFISKVKKQLLVLPNSRTYILKAASIPKALNHGVKKSVADKIVIIDSDCLIDNKYFIHIKKALKTKPIVKGKVIFKGNDFFSKRCATLRKYVYMVNSKSFFAPNIAFDKNVYKKVGKFNELLHCWDYEFGLRAKRLGYFVAYEPKAVMSHLCRDNVKREIKVWFKYGRDDGYCYLNKLLGKYCLKNLNQRNII
jgi:GT2 family glycosyltransferase